MTLLYIFHYLDKRKGHIKNTCYSDLAQTVHRDAINIYIKVTPLISCG